MNLKTFSQVNRVRCESHRGFNHSLDSWSLSDWFTAALGELGEAANVAKKLNRIRDGINGNKETEDQLRQKLRQEVADTFIYLDLLAQSAGFDLSDAVVDTFNAKSEEIGCPVVFTRANTELIEFAKCMAKQQAGYHACTTGDCPHDMQQECSEGLVAEYLESKTRE